MIFPRQHGAWMMLYTPALIAVAVSGGTQPLPIALVVLALTAGFFAQDAWGRRLRGRGASTVTGWLLCYLGILGATGAALLLWYERFELLWLAGPAAMLLAWQAWQRRSSRRHVDRSRLGELAAVAGLCLSAPAVFVAVDGELSRLALVIWGACFAFFASSVFYVKLLVAAGHAVAAPASRRDRWRLIGPTLAYHLVLLAVLVVLVRPLAADVAVPVLVAFGPILARAIVRCARRSTVTPPLRRVGLQEMAFALWFAVFLSIAARVAGPLAAPGQ